MRKRKKEGDFAYPTDPNFVAPGGNEISISIIQEMSTWGEIDLGNAEQVKKRIEDYFNLMLKYDSKPLVNGLAQALGINRHRLYEIGTGRKLFMKTKTTPTPETLELIQYAYDALSVAWEYNFTNGKINPVTGIFLGKNHFGYQDKQDIAIGPTNLLETETEKEEIEKKYLASITTVD